MNRTHLAVAAGCLAAGATIGALWPVATAAPNPGMANLDPTWADARPEPTRTPEEKAATTPAPNVGTAAPNGPTDWANTPRQDWAECVVRALTTPGMGGDADMTDCDDAYYWAAGEPVTAPGLWLWCPGAPEDGGCEARDGWDYPEPISEDVIEEPEYLPGEEPEVLPTPEPSTPTPTVEATPDTTTEAPDPNVGTEQ